MKRVFIHERAERDNAEDVDIIHGARDPQRFFQR
jgi:hypothetical protein